MRCSAGLVDSVDSVDSDDSDDEELDDEVGTVLPACAEPCTDCAHAANRRRAAPNTAVRMVRCFISIPFDRCVRRSRRSCGDHLTYSRAQILAGRDVAYRGDHGRVELRHRLQSSNGFQHVDLEDRLCSGQGARVRGVDGIKFVGGV